MTALPDTPQPTVEAIWAAREAESAERPQYDGYGVSASVLGKPCDRELWYGLRWASEPEFIKGRILRIFERGDIEEQRVVDDLRRAGLTVDDADPATGKQWRFDMARGFLRGKADGRCIGVIEAPKADHVLEVKSAKAADWRGVKRHGLAKHKPDHWHQLHIGMAALGVTRGLYVMVNKDTEEILTERLHLDVEVATQQELRVERLVDSDDAPVRISDKADSFACRFCKHKAVCHEGAFARRHCRTCLHFSFTSEGNGHCSRFEKPLRPKSQSQGADCPAHLYLPDLVPGEQIDACAESETIKYQMPDGTEWTDGVITSQEQTT